MKFGLEARVYQREKVFFNYTFGFVKIGLLILTDRVIEDLNVFGGGVIRKEKEEFRKKKRQWRESINSQSLERNNNNNNNIYIYIN